MFEWVTEFPKGIYLDIKKPIDQAIEYMMNNWGAFFDGISMFLRQILLWVQTVINSIPWWLMILAVLIGAWRATRNPLRALMYAAMLFFIGLIGLWSLMYTTLSIIITSVFISLVLGFPLGILISFSDRFGRFVRPILDTMQTMPSFVYLIPAVMLLGLGNVPAVIATVIYSMPPMVRMTNLGIRSVDREIVEASKAFGATRWQLLVKALIPQAMPTIMAGVNQTIMMAIAMVVTSSMIGARGLGSEVLTGINRLESGRGFAAGIAIVIMAVLIDRLTQGAYNKKEM
ncbi:MAG: proline/glycine betaine ABC transporter permease [Clostridiales bacterium]|nr:proline/glycine betaine ABC transporter permease [Clostridiales bacterium]